MAGPSSRDGSGPDLILALPNTRARNTEARSRQYYPILYGEIRP